MQSAHKRVVRVYAYDGAFDSSDEQSDPLLALSPFLMHNMGDSAKVEVKLFNAGREIPWRTAKAVTIARVASEHSMHRQYQVLLLQALKEYFQAKRRVLRMGDIVALAIDDGLARFTNAESDVDAEKQMGEDDYEWVLQDKPRRKLIVCQAPGNDSLGTGHRVLQGHVDGCWDRSR